MQSLIWVKRLCLIAGDLKIPGVSTSLHPLADGYRVFVGEDADHQRESLAIKFAWFDVRDPQAKLRPF